MTVVVVDVVLMVLLLFPAVTAKTEQEQKVSNAKPKTKSVLTFIVYRLSSLRIRI